MSVDHHVFFGLVIQGELLICLREIELGKVLSFAQSREKVFHPRDWVAIQLRHWIDGDTEVTANADTILVSLQNSHYGGCPLGYFHWFEGPLVLESLEFLVDLIPQGIRD